MLFVPARDLGDRLLQIGTVFGLGQDCVSISGAETFEQKVTCVTSDRWGRNRLVVE